MSFGDPTLKVQPRRVGRRHFWRCIEARPLQVNTSEKSHILPQCNHGTFSGPHTRHVV